MTWEHRGELRADPGIAPDNRNIDPPKRRRSIWPSIAVVAAFAAFGGVIWFAYQNGRNANGNGALPLVKADTGPIKEKPLDPGGKEIPFQDSTVYERLNKGGQKPVVEKLLPPTETPVTRPAPSNQAESNIDPPLVDSPPVTAPPQTASSGARTLAGPPPGTPGGPLPDAGSPTALAPSPGAIVAQTSPPAAHGGAAVKATPTVKATPDSSRSTIAALINGADAPAPKAAADSNGGYRLRLSAVRSPDAVASEWTRLKHRYPELAALKSSSSKVQIPGKGTFYRVEAGPLDEAEAKATCTQLRGQGLGCIVVKP